jgi:hypothetical protein
LEESAETVQVRTLEFSLHYFAVWVFSHLSGDGQRIDFAGWNRRLLGIDVVPGLLRMRMLLYQDRHGPCASGRAVEMTAIR